MELTEQTVLETIAQNDMAAANALVALYERQTADEQQAGTTESKNGVGFNARDAFFLSSLAKQVIEWKGQRESNRRFPFPLSTKQLECARKALPTYRRQLLEIALERQQERQASRSAGSGMSAGSAPVMPVTVSNAPWGSPITSPSGEALWVPTEVRSALTVLALHVDPSAIAGMIGPVIDALKRAGAAQAAILPVPPPAAAKVPVESAPEPCSECNGKGGYWIDGRSSEEPDWEDCPTCQGSGDAPGSVDAPMGRPAGRPSSSEEGSEEYVPSGYVPTENGWRLKTAQEHAMESRNRYGVPNSLNNAMSRKKSVLPAAREFDDYEIAMGLHL